VYDWLPAAFGGRYIVAVAGVALLATALWFRTRDIAVVSVLVAPLMGRFYIAAKVLAYWRMVIVGFFLLAGGTVVSLLKRKQELPDKNVPAVEPDMKT
jgi:hypothetical protein